MKDTAKPMKSIRQAILSTLNTHGELTVDGMLDQITSFGRKTIGANVAQLVTEQLATRRKDDFTGAPAYRITDLGKSRIKSDAVPDEPVKPVVKQNLTTQSANAPITVSAEKIAEIEAAIDAGQAENGNLRAALKESEQVREIHAKSLLDLECEKIELLRENSLLREKQSELLQTNAELARAALSSGPQEQVTVEQFLIRVPKGSKPMFVAKSLEKARQQAMRAAKTVGKVEVFAMVPVGHAVRGAVWNQKQA